MPEPIEKRVSVPLPPGPAFDLFTAGIDRWWPKEAGAPPSGEDRPARLVTVEPREGGRIAELRHDGTQAPWATITEWRPGEALAFDWHGRPGDAVTRVRVTFTPEPGGTRVDLVHAGLGARPAEATRCRRTGRGRDLVPDGCRRGARALAA